MGRRCTLRCAEGCWQPRSDPAMLPGPSQPRGSSESSLTCWHGMDLDLVSPLDWALRTDGSSQSSKHPLSAIRCSNKSMLGYGHCQPRPAPPVLSGKLGRSRALYK